MSHNPIYCETGHAWLGMAEPVNTITNAAALIAAYLAYRCIKRAKLDVSADFALLLLLLTSVGIGSALWHALRTQWALNFDFLSGILFVLVLTVVWIRQLFARPAIGWTAGMLGMVALILVNDRGFHLFGDALGRISHELRFVPLFVTVTVFGVGMMAGTWSKYGRNTALLAIAALACGIFAAVARTMDLVVCPYVPTGTHLLWHFGLSTAAFLGILMVVRMKKVRMAVA